MSAELPPTPRRGSRGRSAFLRMLCSSPRLIVAFALALAPALAPPFVLAQTSSGTVSGTVLDQSGAPVADVAISVTNSATAFERRGETDRAGTFSVPFVPPGRYVVSAVRDGFAKSEVRDVVVNVNDQIALSITLKVRGNEETVNVTAQAGRASIAPGTGTVVDRQFIANIPLNGNSLHALLQLVPGVVLTPNSGTSTNGAQFSVSGQRTTSNYYQVDGVSANTGLSVAGNSGGQLEGITGTGQTAGTNALGGTSSLAALDAIQEFRVETSNFAPEYGRTPGGQIMLVTRGGTNVLHGSAMESFRHEALNANDWFTNRLGLPKPKMRQHLFSAVLGGPIRTNRAFFFASYEGLKLEQPRTRVINVPSLALREAVPVAVRPYVNAAPLPNQPDTTATDGKFAASYSDPSNANATAVRIDALLTNVITGFLRVSHAPSKATSRLGLATSIGHTGATSTFITGGATWVLGSRVTGDIRANWTQNRLQTNSNFEEFGGAIRPDARVALPSGRNPDVAIGYVSLPTGGFAIGRESLDSQRQQNVVGTIAWVQGGHQLKVGADYRRLVPRFQRGLYENVTFLGSDGLLDGSVFYLLNNADPRPREPVISNLSIYAQDTWHVARRLTATYGFRFERVPVPEDPSGAQPRTVTELDQDRFVSPRLAPEGTAIFLPRKGEFAPRVGVAYQVITRANWEANVRGGTGLFHDLGLSTVSDVFRDIYPFYALKRNLVRLPFSVADTSPPILGVDPPSGLLLFDPNLKMPYTHQWHVAWDQAIGPSQMVTIGYVGAKGKELLVRQSYFQALAEWPTRPVVLSVARNAGRSEYDALQLQYQRRLRKGIQALASYTLSLSRDNGTTDITPIPVAGAEQIAALQWAASDYDARHVLSIAATYDIPSVSGRGMLGDLLANWSVDAMFRWQSGFPFNPITVSQVAGLLGVSQRPDLVAGQPFYLDDATVPGGRRVNPAAFAIPTDRTRQGSSPRNSLRAFGASQMDVALRREVTRIGRVRCQLKLDAFNVLNRPSFGPFYPYVEGSLFGQATQSFNQSIGGLNVLYQMGGARSFQVSARVNF